MKKSLFFSLAVLIGLTACEKVQEQNTDPDVLGPDVQFTTVSVDLGMDNGDDTKSLVSIDTENFRNAILFAMNPSTGKVWSQDGNPLIIETTEKSFDWNLPLNTAMDIYCIENFGPLNVSSLKTTNLTKANLEALNYTCASVASFQSLETSNYGLPKAGIKTGVTLTSSSSNFTIKVKNLYAKYNIAFIV